MRIKRLTTAAKIRDAIDVLTDYHESPEATILPDQHPMHIFRSVRKSDGNTVVILICSDPKFVDSLVKHFNIPPNGVATAHRRHRHHEQKNNDRT